jgi:hypothetical protein
MDMRLPPVRLSLAVAVLAVALHPGATRGQSVRDHTRPTPNRSTGVTESQAAELTLTLTEASVRPIQIWVRTAGVIDDAGKTVTALATVDLAARVKTGQRVRAFSPESRSRMVQATVSRVARQGDRVAVTATLAARALEASRYYILEIVTEDHEYLSVPNEALIETGGRQVVYVHQPDGTYAPREVTVGVRGELFTQVLTGLKPGERVVTIGSFFIDAEHRLKG